MNKIIKKAIMLVLCVSAYYSQAQSNQNAHKSMNQEEEKVMQVITKMTAAFHKKDIDGIMSTYEPSAVVVFEPENPISNKKELKEMFMEAFVINPKFTYSGHEVFVTGDSAIHLAPWTMLGMAPDGTKIEQSGLSIAVLRKQEDGSWLMIFDNPHGQYLMDKN
ncbi:YybH family protein [Flagellimonas marina]|uniref:YybH family protein n=1 Tax=Flagellimonas marina TaxID=1775168 RepID=A0ABV8PGA5_9FLAO